MKEERHALVGPPQAWKMKRDFQIAFLRKMGLEPHQYLLDIGCGTLRGGIPLIDYLEPNHYYGVEVRDYVLEEGRKELVDEGLQHKDPVLVNFATFDELNLDRQFEFIWAFSVLIHMSDDIAEECLRFVSRALLPTGKFYANISTWDVDDGTWQEFPLVHRSIPFYQEMAARHGLKAADLGMLKDHGHVTGVASHDEVLRMLVFEKA